MQNRMAQMFTNLGLRALEKSREYYYPPGSSIFEMVEMSDVEFAALIQDIDCFSAQFCIALEERNMGVS